MITCTIRVMALAIGLLVAAITAAAQSTASQAFDVASVKPSAPPDPANPSTMFPGVIPERDGSLRATNASLVNLVRFAYNVDDDQIMGGPPWAPTARFDIMAKPANGSDTSANAGRERLKALLADRFALTAHQEMRAMTVAALVVADKNGKLGRDLKRTNAVCATGTGTDTPCRTFMTPQRDATGRLQMVYRGVGQPLSALANIIGQAIGRRVIDETELTGLFDFETDVPIDPQAVLLSAQRAGFVVPPETALAQALSSYDGPAMTSVLQERLGLKLETRTASVPVVVIDGAEKPSVD